MSKKVEIEVELLRDLVDAAGYVSTFHTMFVNHETPDNCGDLNAAEYLASEAVLIEQRGRAVLEAVEHSVQPTVLCAGHPEGSIAKEGICQECGLPIPHSG